MELEQFLELGQVFFYLQITAILIGMSIIRLFSGLASLMRNRHLIERPFTSFGSWVIHLWAIFFLGIILQNWWQLWFFLEDMAKRMTFHSFIADLIPIFTFYILSNIIYPDNLEGASYQEIKSKKSKFSLEKYYIQHRKLILGLCGFIVIAYMISSMVVFGEAFISVKNILRAIFANVFLIALIFPYNKYYEIALISFSILSLVTLIYLAPIYNSLKVIF